MTFPPLQVPEINQWKEREGFDSKFGGFSPWTVGLRRNRTWGVGGKAGTWQGKAGNLMARMPRKEEETRLPQSSLRPGP